MAGRRGRPRGGGRCRVGVDIGGTFTDIVVCDQRTGGFHIAKLLTTPDDPSSAVLEGISRKALAAAGVDPAAVETVIHGTTLVINAIIERKGAKTCLVTTQGFRDVLEIGRGKRYDIYDLFIDIPDPLVPRSLRREVPERVDKDGVVLLRLDEAAARRVAGELAREGAEAVAVSFLHAYRNPRHERRMAALLRSGAPGVAVSLSCEVMPDIREYERTSTTVCNAYTQPLMRAYLRRLREGLRGLGLRRDLYMMLSDGGIARCETAEKFPVRVIESGPVAGALATAYLSRLTGRDRTLSFDMGGTTAKLAIVDGGRPTASSDIEVARVYRFKRGSGIPVRVPVVEMIEIGAGGGSVARVDGLGLLKVGPDSAGAEPGPACYGRGGEAPTVTDADLVLGYLNPDYFLGGEMRLVRARAEQAILERVARPLGLSLAGAAWGIYEVVNENMARAAKIHLLEKGRDAREYTLFAFGGAGGIHAHRVAEKLEMGEILLPRAAGVTSAFGFLVAPLSFKLLRAYFTPLPDLDLGYLNSLFAEMERDGVRLLAEAGVPRSRVRVERWGALRYANQGYELEVRVPNGRLGPRSLATLEGNFQREFRRRYGRRHEGVAVEAVNWQVTVTGPAPRLRLAWDGAKGARRGALKGRRPAYFPELKGYAEVPVYDRYRLGPGARFRGPAIVEERESTVIVGPGGRAAVDEGGNLIVRLKG